MTDERLPSKKMNRDRLRTIASAALTVTSASVFASDVDVGKFRYIVGIWLIGDGTASRTQTLKYAGAGTGARTANIFPSVPVGPTSLVPLHGQGPPDMDNPIVVLVGGENLGAAQSVGSGGFVVVAYYDSDSWSTNQT